MKPLLQALLLADRIYRDVDSNKHVIAGVFNRLWFKKDGATPRTVVVDGVERQVIAGGVQAGSPSAYISLTEIHGAIDCVLRYVDLHEDKAIFQCGFRIECGNPLETVELTLPLPTLPPKAGIFALELLCDGEPVGSHRVIVEELGREEQEKKHDDGDSSID